LVGLPSDPWILNLAMGNDDREKKKLISIVGDAFADVYCYLDDNTPEVRIGGDARLTQPMTTVAGGSGVNTSTHLQSLINNFGIDGGSYQVNLQTVINENDQYGAILASHSKQHGFNLLNRRVSDFPSYFFGTQESMQQDVGKSTGHCAVIVARGERSFMTHLGCIEDFKGSHIIDESINGSYDLQHLHVTGYYNIVCFWDGDLKQKLAEIKQRNKQITVSLVPQHDATEKWDGGLMDVLEYVDFLILSEVEAKGIAKYHDSVGQSLFEYAAKFFRDNCPNVYVVMTLGSDGCCLLHNGVITQFGTIKKHAVDPTGAGDAFAAGFVFGLMKYMSEEESTRSITSDALKMSLSWGCATGSNCVMVRGASVPSEKGTIYQTLQEVRTINNEVTGV
jgi:sugar/nucleoside kinase (ribokinase family)